MSLADFSQAVAETVVRQPLLKVESLSVDFILTNGERVRPVGDVNLEVGEGEIVCLMGESGCGKSVTVRSIFGLVPKPGQVTSASILFDGQDVSMLSGDKLRTLCRKGVGYVFQDPMTYLNPLMTAGEQVAESMSKGSKVVRGSKKMQRIVKLFADLGIPDPERVIFSYPHQLSGGMRQRVMVAMAMARSPRLLILDEPTTALDVTVQAQIVDLIKEIRRNSNVAVLFVTHDFGLVAELADRVYVMYAGQIVEHGSVGEVFRAPQHPYTQGLIDCVTSLFGEQHLMRSIGGEVPDPRNPLTGCRFYPRCPSSTEKCRSEAPLPMMREGRFIRCWLVGQSGESPASVVKVLAAPPRLKSGKSQSRELLVVENALQYYPMRGGAFGGGSSVVHAVNGVSLNMYPGQVWALVGESGSGKSTLARLITGLEIPKAGRVVINGKDAWAWTQERRGRPLVQMVFQDPYSALNPRKQVRYCLTQPLVNFGMMHGRDFEGRLKNLLEAVGLVPPAEFLGRYPHELSGGQRQRVVLARALAAEPQLLVADEPVSSLDISTRAQILGLLKNLQSEQDLGILLITHDLAMVKSVADHVGVMYLGCLFEVGTAAEVISDPKHPYAQALLLAIPIPDPTRERPPSRLRGEPPSPVCLPVGCLFHPRCPEACETCRRQAPAWHQVGENRLVSCHLYDRG